jgi:hypothetical protein
VNLAGDVLFGIDEFTPNSADPRDEVRRKGVDLFRFVGNATPRDRLRADASARPSYIPRALVVTTGEALPPGDSILARALNIEVRPGDIDKGRLTAAQAEAWRLPTVMLAFIEWMRLRFGLIELWIEPRFRDLREELRRPNAHLRTPTIAAELMLGIELFAEFIVDAGACTPAEAEELAVRCRAGIAESVARGFFGNSTICSPAAAVAWSTRIIWI